HPALVKAEALPAHPPQQLCEEDTLVGQILHDFLFSRGQHHGPVELLPHGDSPSPRSKLREDSPVTEPCRSLSTALLASNAPTTRRFQTGNVTLDAARIS